MPSYDPPNAFYTQISLPAYINPGIFIGNDGFHLKRITELSQCDYLWMDFNRNVVEVWGREHRLPKALRMLKKRMDSFKCDDCKAEAVSKKLQVVQWDSYPGTVHYEIRGTEDECMKKMEDIFDEYPPNPYFTKMESKVVDDNGVTLIKVSRSNSSD